MNDIFAVIRELQDGMKNNWKDALITEIVKDFAEKNEINVVIWHIGLLLTCS